MSNPESQAELANCPFCGCAMHIGSTRDWHKLYGPHDDDCVFIDDYAMIVPASDEPRAAMVRDWNRRAALPPVAAVSGAEQAAPRPSVAVVPDGWISVSDKLPDLVNGEIVYVWASWTGAGDWLQEPKQGLARYIPTLGWQPLGNLGYDWNVTHWQSLPAPPKVVAAAPKPQGE